MLVPLNLPPMNQHYLNPIQLKYLKQSDHQDLIVALAGSVGRRSVFQLVPPAMAAEREVRLLRQKSALEDIRSANVLLFTKDTVLRHHTVGIVLNCVKKKSAVEENS